MAKLRFDRSDPAVFVLLHYRPFRLPAVLPAEDAVRLVSHLQPGILRYV